MLQDSKVHLSLAVGHKISLNRFQKNTIKTMFSKYNASK